MSRIGRLEEQVSSPGAAWRMLLLPRGWVQQRGVPLASPRVPRRSRLEGARRAAHCAVPPARPLPRPQVHGRRRRLDDEDELRFGVHQQARLLHYLLVATKLHWDVCSCVSICSCTCGSAAPLIRFLVATERSGNCLPLAAPAPAVAQVVYARNRPAVEGAQWTGIVTQVRCCLLAATCLAAWLAARSAPPPRLPAAPPPSC